MQKEKTNWKHIHKIKIHDNRWLVWTIAIAVLLCASVVAYIEVTGIDFTTQMSQDYTKAINWTSFTNTGDGYTLKYPKGWAVETDGAGAISFVNAYDTNEYVTVNVYPASQEKDLIKALWTAEPAPKSITNMTDMMIVHRTNQAEQAAVLGDGDNIIVLHGKTRVFEKIVNTFKANQQIE